MSPPTFPAGTLELGLEDGSSYSFDLAGGYHSADDFFVDVAPSGNATRDTLQVQLHPKGAPITLDYCYLALRWPGGPTAQRKSPSELLRAYHFGQPPAASPELGSVRASRWLRRTGRAYPRRSPFARASVTGVHVEVAKQRLYLRSADEALALTIWHLEADGTLCATRQLRGYRVEHSVTLFDLAVAATPPVEPAVLPPHFELASGAEASTTTFLQSALVAHAPVLHVRWRRPLTHSDLRTPSAPFREAAAFAKTCREVARAPIGTVLPLSVTDPAGRGPLLRDARGKPLQVWSNRLGAKSACIDPADDAGFALLEQTFDQLGRLGFELLCVDDLAAVLLHAHDAQITGGQRFARLRSLFERLPRTLALYFADLPTPLAAQLGGRRFCESASTNERLPSILGVKLPAASVAWHDFEASAPVPHTAIAVPELPLSLRQYTELEAEIQRRLSQTI